MDHKERMEITKQIPWVTYLKTPQRCTAYKAMPLKAVYSHGPKRSLPPTGMEPYRCKNSAHWKFRSLKKSWSKDGIYCWTHLFYSGLYGDMEEDARTRKWLEKWMKKNEAVSSTVTNDS